MAILLFLTSCANTDNEIEPNAEPEKDVISYLALGDSYTIGQGVDAYNRWPNLLIDTLKKSDYQFEKDQIIAQTGWTTYNLLQAMSNQDLSDYNLVSLLIGVNNQYRGQDFDVFKSEFDSLLNWSITIANSKSRVFVVSIPDYGVTPFGQSNAEKIAKELDNYNGYMYNKCVEKGVPFVDITTISRIMGNGEGALAKDNLHPSGKQYQQWVNKIAPVVFSLLD
ncbi:MAG: SGNH/GDSL hydrolase family protein [Bacteroidia bacterium]